MDLNLVWFILVAVLLIGYSILDGFDFGVGILHLFTKEDRDRRVNLNAIGPVWDGNEVWLLTGGGALFAAFPIVYATVFSAFYLALMLLLLGLIGRAVSLEFRGKVESKKWKTVWDNVFGIGSLLPALLLGVAFGNILRGIPLDSTMTYTGGFFNLLNPYSVLVGVLSVAIFTMHGAIYLTLKTEGARKLKLQEVASKWWMAVVVIYFLVTFYTYFEARYLFDGILGNPLFWLFFILLMVSIIYVPVGLKAGKTGLTFLASSLMIALMFSLAAVSLFPKLVPSLTNHDFSLTIYNASSSQQTLMNMFIIALVGMPLVIGYTIFVYRVFKGKVILDEHSY